MAPNRPCFRVDSLGVTCYPVCTSVAPGLERSLPVFVFYTRFPFGRKAHVILYRSTK